MITIEAPRIAGRERARDDVVAAAPVAGSTLVVQFPERAAATPSYLDELIQAACSERKVRLVLRHLTARGRMLAEESAERENVQDLVVIEP